MRDGAERGAPVDREADEADTVRTGSLLLASSSLLLFLCNRQGAVHVLLLAPDPKCRRGQPLLQRGGVALLLHTGVRGTMVGVQARVRLGLKKVKKRNRENYRAAGERGCYTGGGA